MIRNKSSVFEASALKSLPFFLFQNSTTRSTDTLEYWMTFVFESFHHQIGCGILFSFKCVRKSSIPLRFVSQAQEWSSVLARISSRIPQNRTQITSFLFFVQSMPLNIDMKMTRSVNFSGSMSLSRTSSWIS